MKEEDNTLPIKIVVVGDENSNIPEEVRNRLEALLPHRGYDIIATSNMLKEQQADKPFMADLHTHVHYTQGRRSGKTKPLAAPTNYEQAFEMLRELTTRKLNVCEYKSQFNHNKNHKLKQKRRRNVVKRKHR